MEVTLEPGSSAVIVVSGIPASGKTTLARSLGERLGMPLISKDTIKEALFDALGSGDLERSRELGRAAHAVMYALAAEQRPVILESFFWSGVAEPDLVGLGCPLIQVWCDCPVDVALARYRHRMIEGGRHPGHHPEHQDDAAVAGWADVEARPLALPGPLIRVATGESVDLDAVVGEIRHAVATQTDAGRRNEQRGA